MGNGGVRNGGSDAARPSWFYRFGLGEDNRLERGEELNLRDHQRRADPNHMRLADAVRLQDILHRSAVALGNLQECFAALDSVMNNLGGGTRRR